MEVGSYTRSFLCLQDNQCVGNNGSGAVDDQGIQIHLGNFRMKDRNKSESL